jgi:hypothetical protein
MQAKRQAAINFFFEASTEEVVYRWRVTEESAMISQYLLTFFWCTARDWLEVRGV